MGVGGHTGCGQNVGFNPFQKKFGRNMHVRTPNIAYLVLTHLLIQLSGKMSSIEVGDSGSGGHTGDGWKVHFNPFQK